MLDEICSVPPPLHTVKIWEWGSIPRGATGPSLFFCFFVCPSRYDARYRKPRRCVYALNLGGTGIRPRTVLVIVPIFVLVLIFVIVLVLVLVLVFVLVFVFVLVLVLVLVLQQAATYSIAAVAGN